MIVLGFNLWWKSILVATMQNIGANLCNHHELVQRYVMSNDESWECNFLRLIWPTINLRTEFSDGLITQFRFLWDDIDSIICSMPRNGILNELCEVVIPNSGPPNHTIKFATNRNECVLLLLPWLPLSKASDSFEIHFVDYRAHTCFKLGCTQAKAPVNRFPNTTSSSFDNPAFGMA